MVYAKYQDNADLLRLSTAGSVDDGKSTLIGKLLLETGSVFDDQLLAVERARQERGADHLNLALLVDGLRAEREQGITIDVAYRYFGTPRRRFIMADTPGHVQYTRNMVTGTSTADLTIVLVDARNGITEQSRRHMFIASLLRVPHFVICFNKMDLVDYARDRFEQLRSEFLPFLSRLEVPDLTFIPISALHGDNIVQRSPRMPWYHGSPLLHHLENVHFASDRNLVDVRLPIQYVIRPHSEKYHDYRGYCGQVASGVLKPGDEITVLPSGFTTRIARIETFDGPVEEAFPPMSVTVHMEDDLDISRGDMVCRPNNQPILSQDLEVMLCWFASTPMDPRGRYALKHTTRSTRALIKELRYRIDINTLHREPDAADLRMNDIGRAVIRTTSPLAFDPYRRNRTTGSLLLMDEASNETVAAGVILGQV